MGGKILATLLANPFNPLFVMTIPKIKKTFEKQCCVL